MTQPTNKLTQFWQELKRRKVFRVIAMYAATAFIIMEAGDIMLPRLGLPDWTVTFIVVLIIVGFPIAIIFSWIFDITPEGIKKTESAKVTKDKETEIKPTKRRLKVSDVIIAVMIVIVCILLYPKIFKKEKVTELEKSIAVLPFINDSPDEENVHFINGTMEAILDNLCKIEDLRVVGRTSVEQYRNAPKPILVIAEEMDVSYILEGSGQKYGNNVQLTFQLLDARNDKHLWSSPYSRKIVIEEIFELQSEIAQLVAAEIKAIITPEEKQLIEKTPTANLTAYDFYQRGREEHWKYWIDNNNSEALKRADALYHKALEYDSTFALSYTGLAWVYWDKHYWKTYFSEDFLDSVLILADIALSYDDQIAEAYTIRGDCYRDIGQTEKAIREYNKAIELNPNSWMAYWGMGLLYSGYDFVKSLENNHKAVFLNRGSELPILLKQLALSYYRAGIIDRSGFYAEEALSANPGHREPWFPVMTEPLIVSEKDSFLWVNYLYNNELDKFVQIRQGCSI
ncbi:MAG: tetratricopeptide repeat protein [Candidatus Heimdallarchaeota archaeon]